MGMAVTQLSAQNGQNGTGSVSEIWLSMENPFPIPVSCNGIQVDMITDFLCDWHVVSHYQKGIYVFCRVQCFGDAYSESGEHFDVKEIVKQDYIGSKGTVHLNLRGDEGSHYIVTIGYDWSSGNMVFTPIRGVCAGKGN